MATSAEYDALISQAVIEMEREDFCSSLLLVVFVGAQARTGGLKGSNILRNLLYRVICSRPGQFWLCQKERPRRDPGAENPRGGTAGNALCPCGQRAVGMAQTTEGSWRLVGTGYLQNLSVTQARRYLASTHPLLYCAVETGSMCAVSINI